MGAIEVRAVDGAQIVISLDEVMLPKGGLEGEDDAGDEIGGDFLQGKTQDQADDTGAREHGSNGTGEPKDLEGQESA